MFEFCAKGDANWSVSEQPLFNVLNLYSYQAYVKAQIHYQTLSHDQTGTHV